ncbi:phosphatase PAP2 family protein [Aquabacterium sp.]|uniref:phosphatase PAP2 family protein n=1 Tax=Aquabacterium sp. TaxID=1872578 RepID=UPI003783F992
MLSNAHESAGGLAWQIVTRLGEAQLLLPAMAATVLWLVLRRDAWRLALCWLLATGAAASLTTASKVAFIGYGVGYAPWDFTGFSGHAMFAAAVLPVMCRLAEGSLPERWHGHGLAFGYALAALVAASRVPVLAHSWSEALSGYALGAMASAVTLWAAQAPRLRFSPWLLGALALGLSLGVAQAPPSRTHDMVTRLSLALSRRPQPYTRLQMHRDFRRQHLQTVQIQAAQQAAQRQASCQASGTAPGGSASKPTCSITRTPWFSS